MADIDLSMMLRSWPFEPGRINARLITGEDGRPKLQVRILLGVLQLETTGRPDGDTPHGCDTLREYHQSKLAKHIERVGNASGFKLTSNDCADLREEALQYYHRYVGLFAIRDYGGVIRDAGHNLAIFDLCRDHGPTETDRTVLEQFRPQVIAMLARCEAELAVGDGRPRDAMAALDRGIDALRAVYAAIGEGEAAESSNELELLRGMRDVMVPKLPASQRAELMERLRAALDAENFELAAILRDELKLL